MSKAKAEQKAAEEPKQPKYWAAPYDARFPNINQSRHCAIYYVDYNKCKRLKGDDYAPCEYFKRVYVDLCPSAWVEAWDQRLEEGKFPVHLPKQH